MMRTGFWSILGLVMVWAYTRGPQGVVDDVFKWKDIGLAHWQTEYKRWNDQARAAQAGFGGRPQKQNGLFDALAGLF